MRLKSVFFPVRSLVILFSLLTSGVITAIHTNGDISTQQFELTSENKLGKMGAYAHGTLVSPNMILTSANFGKTTMVILKSNGVSHQYRVQKIKPIKINDQVVLQILILNRNVAPRIATPVMLPKRVSDNILEESKKNYNALYFLGSTISNLQSHNSILDLSSHRGLAKLTDQDTLKEEQNNFQIKLSKKSNFKLDPYDEGGAILYSKDADYYLIGAIILPLNPFISNEPNTLTYVPIEKFLFQLEQVILDNQNIVTSPQKKITAGIKIASVEQTDLNIVNDSPITSYYKVYDSNTISNKQKPFYININGSFYYKGDTIIDGIHPVSPIIKINPAKRSLNSFQDLITHELSLYAIDEFNKPTKINFKLNKNSIFYDSVKNLVSFRFEDLPANLLLNSTPIFIKSLEGDFTFIGNAVFRHDICNITLISEKNNSNINRAILRHALKSNKFDQKSVSNGIETLFSADIKPLNLEADSNQKLTERIDYTQNNEIIHSIDSNTVLTSFNRAYLTDYNLFLADLTDIRLKNEFTYLGFTLGKPNRNQSIARYRLNSLVELNGQELFMPLYGTQEVVLSSFNINDIKDFDLRSSIKIDVKEPLQPRNFTGIYIKKAFQDYALVGFIRESTRLGIEFISAAGDILQRYNLTIDWIGPKPNDLIDKKILTHSLLKENLATKVNQEKETNFSSDIMALSLNIDSNQELTEQLIFTQDNQAFHSIDSNTILTSLNKPYISNFNLYLNNFTEIKLQNKPMYLGFFQDKPIKNQSIERHRLKSPIELNGRELFMPLQGTQGLVLTSLSLNNIKESDLESSINIDIKEFLQPVKFGGIYIKKTFQDYALVGFIRESTRKGTEFISATGEALQRYNIKIDWIGPKQNDLIDKKILTHSLLKENIAINVEYEDKEAPLGLTNYQNVQLFPNLTLYNKSNHKLSIPLKSQPALSYTKQNEHLNNKDLKPNSNSAILFPFQSLKDLVGESLYMYCNSAKGPKIVDFELPHDIQDQPISTLSLLTKLRDIDINDIDPHVGIFIDEANLEAPRLVGIYKLDIKTFTETIYWLTPSIQNELNQLLEIPQNKVTLNQTKSNPLTVSNKDNEINIQSHYLESIHSPLEFEKFLNLDLLKKDIAYINPNVIIYRKEHDSTLGPDNTKNGFLNQKEFYPLLPDIFVTHTNKTSSYKKFIHISKLDTVKDVLNTNFGIFITEGKNTSIAFFKLNEKQAEKLIIKKERVKDLQIINLDKKDSKFRVLMGVYKSTGSQLELIGDLYAENPNKPNSLYTLSFINHSDITGFKETTKQYELEEIILEATEIPAYPPGVSHNAIRIDKDIILRRELKQKYAINNNSFTPIDTSENKILDELFAVKLQKSNLKTNIKMINIKDVGTNLDDIYYVFAESAKKIYKAKFKFNRTQKDLLFFKKQFPFLNKNRTQEDLLFFKKRLPFLNKKEKPFKININFIDFKGDTLELENGIGIYRSLGENQFELVGTLNKDRDSNYTIQLLTSDLITKINKLMSK